MAAADCATPGADASPAARSRSSSLSLQSLGSDPPRGVGLLSLGGDLAGEREAPLGEAERGRGERERERSRGEAERGGGERDLDLSRGDTERSRGDLDLDLERGRGASGDLHEGPRGTSRV